MSHEASRSILIAAAVGLAAAAAPGAAQRKPARPTVVKERINPGGLASPVGYTHVVTARGGRTVYVSGQVALDGGGNLVGKGDLRTQAEQVFTNLRLALEAAGAGFGDVVKLNTYVVGYRPEMLETLRRVRSSRFGTVALPASTLVGVQALARDGFLIEVEAVAVVD